MRKLSRYLALGAFFVATAVALAACGGDSIPGDAVAKVGDTAITKDQFSHWLKIAAISPAGSAEPDQAGANAQVPDAPNFTRCIAEKKKTAPKPAKGQPKPTDAQFKAQCSQQYEGLKQQVLQFLISSAWIQGEAKDQGVTVTDKDVETQFEKTKKQSFPKEADFQKFLRPRGCRWRTSSSASSSTRSRTSSAPRSPRARTRSPTSRSATTTTRTSRASPSPSG